MTKYLLAQDPPQKKPEQKWAVDITKGDDKEDNTEISKKAYMYAAAMLDLAYRRLTPDAEAPLKEKLRKGLRKIVNELRQKGGESP